MFAMFGLLPTTLLALYIYSSIMYIKIALRMQHNKYWQSIFDSYPVIPQINMRKCNITKALRKLQSLGTSLPNFYCECTMHSIRNPRID